MKWENPDLSDEDIITALKNAQAYEFVSKLPMGLDSHVEQGGKTSAAVKDSDFALQGQLRHSQRYLFLTTAFPHLTLQQMRHSEKRLVSTLMR